MARRQKRLWAFVLMLAGCGGIGMATGALPRGYDLLFSPAPHAFGYAISPQPVRRGNRSERFELRNGDCGGSDCTNPRYRAEIMEKRPTAGINQNIWYGWSFRNQTIPTFDQAFALRVVLGQWKVSGETPPAFRLVQIGQDEGNWAGCDPAICTPGGDPRADVVLQLTDMAQSRGWGARQNDGHICRLFNIEDARGQWMDIVVNTNFGTDTNGYLSAWVNGEQRCAYRGPVVATPGGTVSVRRGIFASFTTRWDQTLGSLPKPLMIAFYDEFRIGKTREDVDVRLREAAGLSPLD
jgi:hypothetical protein